MIYKLASDAAEVLRSDFPALAIVDHIARQALEILKDFPNQSSSHEFARDILVRIIETEVPSLRTRLRKDNEQNLLDDFRSLVLVLETALNRIISITQVNTSIRLADFRTEIIRLNKQSMNSLNRLEEIATETKSMVTVIPDLHIKETALYLIDKCLNLASQARIDIFDKSSEESTEGSFAEMKHYLDSALRDILYKLEFNQSSF